MTVRNCSQSWTASGSHAPQDVGDHARAQIASSPTKATAIRAVGAGCAQRQIKHTIPERRDQRAQRASSTRTAASLRQSHLRPSQCRRALHQSAQTVAWAGDPLRETRRSTIARWSSSPPSSSGSRPISEITPPLGYSLSIHPGRASNPEHSPPPPGLSLHVHTGGSSTWFCVLRPARATQYRRAGGADT